MNRDKVKAEFVISGPDHYAHALNYAEIALKILDPSLAGSDAIIKPER
jgi:flagellar biosynthesis protein FlhB